MTESKYIVTLLVGDFPLNIRKYAETIEEAIEIAKKELTREMMDEGHDPSELWAPIDIAENEDLVELPFRIVEIKDWDIESFVVIDDENDIDAIIQHHGG